MRLATRSAAVALIILCLITQACSPDEVRKAAKTASVGITALRGLRDTNASQLARGRITKDESNTNVRLMQDASTALGELNDRAREANEKIIAIDAQIAADPDNADLKRQRDQVVKSAGQDLKPLIRAAITAITNLNDQGVLRVKNPDARAQLSDLMSFLLSVI